MKIKKFNESNNDNNVVLFLIIDINNENDVVHSGVFETRQDFDNWILNLVNESIGADPDDNIEGTVLNNEGEQIFIDVNIAMNYYQWYYDLKILVYETKIYKNIEAKYGVNLTKNLKKYNL